MPAPLTSASVNDTLIRLKTPLARAGDRQYRAGEKYLCPANEAARHIANDSAEPCTESEPDYIPIDGVDAHVIVNKTVREQTTTVQPRRHPSKT